MLCHMTLRIAPPTPERAPLVALEPSPDDLCVAGRTHVGAPLGGRTIA